MTKKLELQERFCLKRKANINVVVPKEGTRFGPAGLYNFQEFKHLLKIVQF
jgi:hypothetical protein